MQAGVHNPIIDATYAIKVFSQYRYLHDNDVRWQCVQDTLSRNPVTPSFSTMHPFIDKVAMSWQAEQNH